MNRPDKSSLGYYLGILVFSALLFIPFLGQVHLFDWDEINFAESAREMISSHDYLTVQINYIPFWEKPPLFIWMQVLSMKAFGINEFAARFPNAICGIITLLLLFKIGSKLIDNKFGLLWVVLFGGSLLPFIYFKSGIIDPWFNLFIFAGIWWFYNFLQSDKNGFPNLAASAVFIGLAVLTKGPVAFLIFLLTFGIYLFIQKFKVKIRFMDIAIFLVIVSLVGGFWFLLQIFKGNYGIVYDFVMYQIRLFHTHGAGHRGFLLYHFVVLLLGVFPASLMALPALLGSKSKIGTAKEFLKWMLILFWVVLILFTIVRTKIVHYSSMCYFPLTFVSAWWVYHVGDFSSRQKTIIRNLVVILGMVLALIVSGLTFVDNFKEIIIRKLITNDPFAVACLNADAGWKGYEWIVGLVMITGVILFAGYWNRNRFKAIYMLSGFVSVFIFLSLYLIAPRIEMYTQRPAIEFFQSVSGKDGYVLTLGYKSYAHLFYGRSKIHENNKSADETWLLTGAIDKPVFISAKAYKKNKYLTQYPDLVLIYEKNGFAFFERLPK